MYRFGRETPHPSKTYINDDAFYDVALHCDTEVKHKRARGLAGYDVALTWRRS